MEKFEQSTAEISRDEQSEKLIKLMDRLHAHEVFSDTDSKQHFIENLTFDQFQKFLNTANGLLRDIPLHERGVDGGSVALVSQNEGGGIASAFAGLMDETRYPPRQQDKDVLLKEMFDLAKRLSKEGDIETVALLSAAGINAIHQFMDGNGRTSRLAYFLLTENYTGSEDQVEKLKKILGDEGRLYVNIDPGLIEREIEDHVAFNELGINPEDNKSPRYLSSFGGKKINDSVSEGVSLDFKQYILDDKSRYGFFAVYKFLKENGKLHKVVKSFEENGEIVRTDLRVADVFKELGLEDYEKILEIYWQLKKEGVSILLNAIARPEDYPTAPSVNENHRENETIKESFLKSVDNGYKKSYEEVNAQDISVIWDKKDNLPFSEQSFTLEDLNHLRCINEVLENMVEAEKQERESLQFDMEKAEKEFDKQRRHIHDIDLQKTGNTEGISGEAEREIFDLRQKIYKPILDISKKYLEKAIIYLDSLDIWKTKYTTRSPIRYLSETLQELSDSIYYVTQGGQSLRLKKYELLKGGLKDVVQPFTEKTFFIKNEDEASDEPQIDSNVVEYYTKEFLAVQKKDNTQEEFKSKIRRYEKDGKVVYLNPVDGSVHKGYAVNKILK